MKRFEKLIWFGVIPVTAAALWLARRLAQQPAAQGMMASSAPAPAAPATASAADDLKLIVGIGPVYERRLQAAGIRTFSDLQKASPQRLLDIVQATPGLADTEDWIKQAGALAAGR